ncbi:hypothetical protein F2P81_025149 [Scophthalmus maximus]|uniref:TELO2-interacting protein 2 n=1 Tax=Scophthalmus maximus TaxID=52904 RepID=A0A6A4RKZ1_SCOMX|nr:hypothetical protein F2P81_025149 [Scophthalmus maximus]
MELSSLLHELHLSSSEKPLPSAPLPPITELLSRLQEKLIGVSSDSETSSLIGRVERLFQTADPDWLFSPASANEDGGQAALESAYGSLIGALIGCAALPLCEDDCGSLPVAAYQSVPSRAVPVCSALGALLGALGKWEEPGLLLSAVVPAVCVFTVTHFQVSVDGKRPENCMLGVRCLHHIVLNTFNRAEVVYQALFKHLYTTEAAVIQLVLSCLLDLLLVLETPPSSLTPSSARRKPCRHDDVLRLVLTHMEAENKVPMRRVYASVLPPLVDRMGVAVCRHLQRLQRVVLGYLEIKDPPEETNRLKVLEVLQKTTRAAWPRMEGRVNTLLRCLLRLLVDVSSDSQLDDSVRHELTNQTLSCIRLLDQGSGGPVQSPCDGSAADGVDSSVVMM